MQGLVVQWSNSARTSGRARTNEYYTHTLPQEIHSIIATIFGNHPAIPSMNHHRQNMHSHDAIDFDISSRVCRL